MNALPSSAPGSSGDATTAAFPPVVPDFTLARPIGRGSYGDVWLARDALGFWRAVKVVRRDRFEQDAQYDREFTGISAYAPLSHAEPELLRLFHVGRNDAEGYFYYALELADDVGATTPSGRAAKPQAGGSLSLPSPAAFSPETYVPKTLRHVQRQRGRLPLVECLKIGRELVAALDHLHSRGLAHRDVKPSNVVFVRDAAKLADIGLVTSSDRTLTLGVGTAGYLAPEGGGTAAADFFALGKVLYELITGCDRMNFPKLPPLREIPEAERKGIRELNVVVLKACDPNPDRRYRTAAEFDGELLALQAGRSLDLQRRVVRQLKRAAAVLALLALVGAAMVGWQWQRNQATRSALRGKIIAEVNAMGNKDRAGGWTTNAAAKLREAAALGPGADIHEAAAQLLVGMDARVHWFETNAPGSSLAWNAIGNRLLIGGQRGARTRVFDLRTTNCMSIMADSPGPVVWRADDEPIQFRASLIRTNTHFYFKQPGATNDLRYSIRNLGSIEPISDMVMACSADGARAALSGVFTNESDARSFKALWILGSTNRTNWSALGRTNIHATALALTPDGSLLATGQADGKVEVFSLPDFTSLAVFETNEPLIQSLAFGREPLRLAPATPGTGWRLAAGTGATTIHVWELARRRLLARLRGSAYAVYSLAFSPDGALLASGGRSFVRLWDIANEQQILSLRPGWGISMDYVTALAFSPDGRYLAGTSHAQWDPGFTWVAELITHRGVQPLYGLGAQIEQTWISQDGRWLAALSHEWRLGVWEVKTGRLRHVFLPPISGFPDNAALVFHPDGKIYFASGSEARVWDVESGEQLESIPLGSGLGDRMRLLGDGRVMLLRRESRPSGGHNWTLRDLRGANPSTPLFQQTEGDWSGYLGGIAPNGKYFVATGQTSRGTNPRMELMVAYDLATGRELWRTNLPALAGERAGTGRDIEFAATREAVRFIYHTETNSWHTLSNGAVVTAEAQLPSAFGSVKITFRDAWILEASRIGSRAGPLAFGLDYPPVNSPSSPCLSADGTRVAWGTLRGVPLLADLPEIARQMQVMGYKW